MKRTIRTEAFSVNELAAYEPTSVAFPPTMVERLRTLAREVSASPERAATATLGASLAVISAVALMPVTIHTRDARGPLTFKCGLQYFAFGHKSLAVQQTCRDAYSGRATVFTASTVALLVTVVALVVLLRRPAVLQGSAKSHSLCASAGRAALSTAAGVFLLVTLASLVPVRIHAVDSQSALSAECGVNYFLSGNDNAVVEHACRRAYSGHALSLFLASIGFAICATALAVTLHLERAKGRLQASVT
jgi:hypothetical protein